MATAAVEVEALSRKLSELLGKHPELTKDVVDSLKVLVEDVAAVNAEGGAELAVDGNTGDADVHNSILRRTQFNVRSRAQGEESTEKVEGMLDPVSGSGLGERLITTPNQYTSGGTEGLAQFKKGFLRFKQEVIRTHADHFKSLAASQSPKVMVIACCDSRVDPALLMGAGPGDIFTVRNIANLVPPFERQGTFHGTSAALEYAVCALKVEHIVVMGHQKCGGIRALMERGKEVQARNDFIDNWMEIASAACERTRLDAGQMDLAQQCAYCERESINVSLANLLTFPWIKDAVSRRALQLHGWYYDMEQSAMSTWKLRYQITDYTKLQ